jgi:hypothetical protein
LRNRDLPVRQDQQHRKDGSKDDGGKGGGTSGFETCAEQLECISFEVKQLTSSDCGGICPVEVCLVIDLSLTNCAKDSGTISHVCDNANVLGCQYYTDPTVTDGDSSAQLCGAQYPINGYHSTAKCQDVPSGFKMCQSGGTGDWLEFIL